MEFRIDERIFEKYPELLVGLLMCTGIVNTPSPPEIIEMLRTEERNLRSRSPDPEALKAHPPIAAWQDVHRAFGSNPNKYPSSIHALCKRVLKGGELPSINALVDLYNIISLRHMLPVGGEDLDRCRGDIALTLASGTESFTPLGGTENEPPEVNEVIYRDSEGVLCRKFNWRESARTCLTEKTTNAVLVIEAVPPTYAPQSGATAGRPTPRVELETALRELQELVTRFCGGRAESAILDAPHPLKNL